MVQKRSGRFSHNGGTKIAVDDDNTKRRTVDLSMMMAKKSCWFIHIDDIKRAAPIPNAGPKWAGDLFIMMGRKEPLILIMISQKYS